MSNPAEPEAEAEQFDVPGCTSPRLLERDDYASLFEADSGGQRVHVVCLGDDIVEHSDVTQAFVEQAEAISILRQPAFLAVLDSATAGADVYVVYEAPDGVLVDDLCGATTASGATTGPALLPAAAAHLGAELCAALEALHAEGLAHGELTPRAVSIAQGDQIRITPASLGCVVRNVPARNLCRRLVYQAPEALAQSALRVEPSADIYAVGVLLWEALSGRPLLRADTVEDFVAAARAGAPPNLKIERVVPSALNAAVQRALDRDPAARPSAAELRAQLAAVAGTVGRSTLAAAVRKVRSPAPGSAAHNAQRLRTWSIPVPPPSAPATASASTKAETAPAPKSKPEPAVSKAEPALSKPAPALSKPEPTLSKPEPTVAKPEPVAAKPEPAIAKPEPAIAKPEPAIAKPEPAIAKPEPAIAKPEPAPPRPVPVLMSPQEEDEEETRLWRRPEPVQPKAQPKPQSDAATESDKPPAEPSAEEEAESARAAALAAQLRDFDGDEDEDEDVKLPVPIDQLRVIGPSSYPAGETSSLSRRVPARAKRRMRPLVVAILVCMAVLCALLVVSVARPLPNSGHSSGTSHTPTGSHE